MLENHQLKLSGIQFDGFWSQCKKLLEFNFLKLILFDFWTQCQEVQKIGLLRGAFGPLTRVEGSLRRAASLRGPKALL
jgi:hypothetical protein